MQTLLNVQTLTGTAASTQALTGTAASPQALQGKAAAECLPALCPWSGYEEWIFALEDGTTVTKKVAVMA